MGRMELLVFGGIERTGRALVEQALEQGHVVTVFARNAAKMGMAHENLRVMKGDIADYDSVETAIEAQDAVLSALGTKLHAGLAVVLVVLSQVIAREVVLSGIFNLLLRMAVPLFTWALSSGASAIKNTTAIVNSASPCLFIGALDTNRMNHLAACV
jgi:NAD(P)-dependent dehydrogenase (short-subunit alcohol dehydrogenase family)